MTSHGAVTSHRGRLRWTSCRDLLDPRHLFAVKWLSPFPSASDSRRPLMRHHRGSLQMDETGGWQCTQCNLEDQTGRIIEYKHTFSPHLSGPLSLIQCLLPTLATVLWSQISKIFFYRALRSCSHAVLSSVCAIPWIRLSCFTWRRIGLPSIQ